MACSRNTNAALAEVGIVQLVGITLRPESNNGLYLFISFSSTTMAHDNYGRHRKSIANIEEELHNLMSEHPLCHFNENEEPVVPGHALVDIFARFSESHDDVELMSKDEENQLIQFLASNESVEATPKVLIEFIAIRTTAGVNNSVQDAAAALSSDEGSENESSISRGRQDRGVYNTHSRSSSTDSTGTSVYQSASRPPSRGPVTPNRDSVFDTSKRQRSTPLAAPSSWAKRPLPASRRKSDSGGRASSDSEVCDNKQSSIAYRNVLTRHSVSVINTKRMEEKNQSLASSF